MCAIIFSLLASPLFAVSVRADEMYGSTTLNSGNLNFFVCDTLGSVGLGCGNVVNTVSGNYNSGYSGATDLDSILGSVFNSGSTSNNTTSYSSQNNSSGNNSALTASIYVAGKKQYGNDSINLVRVGGRSEIYEIVDGKKHLIPTIDIFSDYGFSAEAIQDITQGELDKFPRVRLVSITGDKKKIYYLTEAGTIRLSPNKKVFDSYGNMEEDVVVISKKEFNYYPQNQFVFLKNSSYKDVYQLVDGKTKRYITPVAVKRMRINTNQIAPVNETELASYKTGKPIVL